jgi:hypothetical protein
MTRRIGRIQRWQRALAVLLVPACLLVPTDAGAGITQLTLWDKSFRAELVVRVTVLDPDDRLAVMQVDEVIKGTYFQETLKVVFRMENFAREMWQERIEFVEGGEMILFLEHFRKRGIIHKPDQFALLKGTQGKVDVPPEGADAFLQAVRRFAEIQTMGSQLAIWRAARELLEEENPYLVEAGFEQILKFRLSDEELVPVLLTHLDAQAVPFRQQAARALGQVFEEYRYKDEVLNTEDHMRDLLLHKAINDQSEVVRVESIRALEAKWDEGLLPSLRRIAKEDPSQAVRYQAERAIYAMENDGDDGESSTRLN